MTATPLIISVLHIFVASNALVKGLDINDPKLQLTSDKSKINYTSLAIDHRCESIVKLHCNGHPKSEFQIIECLEDPKTVNSVNEECKVVIQQRKKQLLTKPYFEAISPSKCLKEFRQFTECQLHMQSELYVPCLLEHKQEIKQNTCVKQLNQAAVFVFDDYRLLTNLVQACQSDLRRYNCDSPTKSVDPQTNDLERLVTNSRDTTLRCLTVRIGKLETACRIHLLKVRELQSDDYHLDRNLYYACRDDRERLCNSVNSGDGGVYDCLRANKYNPLMSKDCSDAIIERQQLRAVDYRISFTFTDACTVDIKKWHCDSLKGSNSGASLSRIILCLEGVEKVQLAYPTNSNDSPYLNPRCKSELQKVRRELLQDYRLSPNLMVHCDSTIKKHCANQKNQPGLVIHCLIQLIRQTSQPDERPSEDCINSIHDVLKTSDVQENVLLDPVIIQACHVVLSQQCADRSQDHGSIFTCLIENRRHPMMTSDCRKHIYELYYFISRDIMLDDQLIRACLSDARQLCHLSDSASWDTIKPDAHLLTCLYNHRNPSSVNQTHVAASLSSDCRTEVQRMMLDRAASVSLEPRVFEPCLADLVAYCDDEEQDDDDDDDDGDVNLEFQDDGAENLKGQSKPKLTKMNGKSKSRSNELTHGLPCLQNNLEHLRPECREAVVEVSAEAQEEPNLDKMILEACTPAENRFCSAYEDPKEVVACLIRHKHDMDMELACRWAIEHLQIVALTDIRISKGFHQACFQDIQKHCNPNAARTQDKASVLTCLSEILTNYRLQELQKVALVGQSALVKPSKSPISPNCAGKLRFELLQRSESIRLDPLLEKACQNDRDEFCDHITEGNAQVISCLRQNRDRISTKCHSVLFQRDLLAAVENRVDYSLMQMCRDMIQLHCSALIQNYDMNNEADSSQDIVECLKNALQRDRGRGLFDRACRTKLIRTLELHSQDYRLDPNLMHDCHSDALKFCPSQVNNTSAYERHGQVLRCLKPHFIERRNTKLQLSHSCYNRIRSIVLWENMVHHLDPLLTRACKSEIELHCSDALLEDRQNPDEMNGLVGECLKRKLNQDLITNTKCQQEIIMNIEEARSDIHVDLILYQACSIELQYYCNDVPPGNGRKMKCLLTLYDSPDGRQHMSPSCQKQLTERRQLWKFVTKLKPVPENLNDLIAEVSQSHSRNSLLVCLFIFVSLIFIMGLCCGRVTKRIPVEVKVK